MVEGCFSVVKEMARVHRATIELGMDLGGWLSTQEVRVVLGYRLVVFLRLFRASQREILPLPSPSCLTEVRKETPRKRKWPRELLRARSSQKEMEFLAFERIRISLK